MKYYILLFPLISIVSGFLHIPFGIPFKVSNKEIHQSIIPLKNSETLNKLDGFFGLIGPDVNISSVSSLFELFTGNGVIQGIFFDKRNLTYIKHYVRTEKLIYEEANGQASTGIFFNVIYHILHILGVLPNMLGVANTSLLTINNNIYAMFERDNPYLMKVDFHNKQVNTIQKLNFKDLSSTHFSGHTKYSSKKITTIHYDVISKCIHHYVMTGDFKTLYKTILKTEYLPIIHDFLLLNDSFVITDSPIMMDIHKILKFKLPVTFYKDKKTNVYIVAKNKVNRVEYDKGFYIFHYADYRETDDIIEIYAPLYDDLDFLALNIKGNYRKIVIDKKTNKMIIEKNEEIEQYNLDFPIKVGNKIILRNIKEFGINGFIICEGLNILGKMLFDDITICGEPALTYIDSNPYLIAFAYDETTNFILLINVETLEVEKIEIPLQNDQKINIGFHSIYIPNDA